MNKSTVKEYLTFTNLQFGVPGARLCSTHIILQHKAYTPFSSRPISQPAVQEYIL